MSKVKDKKRWEEFERELDKAIEADRATPEKERLAWLNTLPEYVPLTDDSVQVVFFGPRKRPAAKPRNEKKTKKRKPSRK